MTVHARRSTPVDLADTIKTSELGHNSVEAHINCVGPVLVSSLRTAFCFECIFSSLIVCADAFTGRAATRISASHRGRKQRVRVNGSLLCSTTVPWGLLMNDNKVALLSTDYSFPQPINCPFIRPVECNVMCQIKIGQMLIVQRIQRRCV